MENKNKISKYLSYCTLGLCEGIVQLSGVNKGPEIYLLGCFTP
jgi:hypothetical protein